MFIDVHAKEILIILPTKTRWKKSNRRSKLKKKVGGTRKRHYMDPPKSSHLCTNHHNRTGMTVAYKMARNVRCPIDTMHQCLYQFSLTYLT